MFREKRWLSKTHSSKVQCRSWYRARRAKIALDGKLIKICKSERVGVEEKVRGVLSHHCTFGLHIGKPQTKGKQP